MTDPTVELYIATLSEVQRQSAVHLGSASDATAGGGGAASDSNGWVVLESQSTTAQLPGETGCSVWPQQQWQIAYEILVRAGRLGSHSRSARAPPLPACLLPSTYLLLRTAAQRLHLCVVVSMPDRA